MSVALPHREIRLRKRIDQLLTEADRNKQRAEVAEQRLRDAEARGVRTRKHRRCSYCGAPYDGRGIACPAHSDLPGIDEYGESWH